MLSLLPFYFEIEQEPALYHCNAATLVPANTKHTLVNCFEKDNEPKRSTAQRPFEQKGIPQSSSLISLVT